ncbi:hypothetical protein DXG01_008898 [Tephrocybe rancida]|nr:hypothetical protein DXG01_008898 [Tephrocybe rancida]
MSRHPDFWLHDGSIVLSVEGTLFRVHQTILTHHSQIFADLFSLPQAPHAEGQVQVVVDGGDETIEGCRVVELHDDSAADFEDLLGAIYHPSHFDALPPACELDVLIAFVAGILRLSTKYLIPALRKRCITLLSERIPTTWSEFVAAGGEANEGKGGMKVKAKGGPRGGPGDASMSASASSGAGNAQVDTDAPTYGTVTFSMATGSGAASTVTPPTSAASGSGLGLPPLSADASSGSHPPVSAHPHRSRRHSTSHHHSSHREKKPKAPPPRVVEFPPPKHSSLMRLVSLAQSTNVPLLLPYAYYLLARTSAPRRFLVSSPSSLPWDLKTTLLVGRTHLHAAQLSLSHAFLLAPAPPSSCRTPEQCARSRGPLVEWAMLSASGKGPEPLRAWDRWEKLGVCQACEKHARGRHERGREEVWERLPGFFEMGSWRSLGRAQDA